MAFKVFDEKGFLWQTKVIVPMGIPTISSKGNGFTWSLVMLTTEWNFPTFTCLQDPTDTPHTYMKEKFMSCVFCHPWWKLGWSHELYQLVELRSSSSWDGQDEVSGCLWLGMLGSICWVSQFKCQSIWETINFGKELLGGWGLSFVSTAKGNLFSVHFFKKEKKTISRRSLSDASGRQSLWRSAIG